MDDTRSRKKWIGIIIPEALPRFAALFLCAGILMAAGMGTKAAETGLPESTSSENTSSEGASSEETGDLVMIRVEAEPEETDREALLDRINAIRREACEEGINNPVNGEPMTPSDYVPLQWSGALEEIAALRAAESTVLQDHMRPDGTECFTAAPEGVSYTMETLAWGFDSAADAVEGWYSEKSSYLNADGKPAGHYMALINPENRYVGIADLRAQWQRDACAGAFGAGGSEGEPVRTEVNGEGESVWMIPLREDFLPSVIERALEVTAGRIFRAAQSVARG